AGSAGDPRERCFARIWASNGLECDDPRFTSQTLGTPSLFFVPLPGPREFGVLAPCLLLGWYESDTRLEARKRLRRLRVSSGHSYCNHQILRGAERRMMHGSTL